MSIHKIDFEDVWYNRPDSQKPPLKAGNFYLKATFICQDCNHEEDVLINKTKEVYHECNEGHVRCNVPELKLPQEVSKNLKLLKGQKK